MWKILDIVKEIISGLEEGQEVLIPDSNGSNNEEMSERMKEMIDRMSDPASSFSRMQGIRQPGGGGSPPGGGPPGGGGPR